MPVQSNVSFILASTSPRRKELLTQASYKFRICPPDIDESASASDAATPSKYAEMLALAKAKSVALKFPEDLVIGVDTVVNFAGQIIGKPTDQKHAEQIIRKLFSATHKVITAIAFVRLLDGIELVKTDTTTVYPKRLSDEQIANHIQSGSWREKAGAYAIKQAADKFVEKIDGSLTNAMGLPMELLQKMFEKTACSID